MHKMESAAASKDVGKEVPESQQTSLLTEVSEKGEQSSEKNKADILQQVRALSDLGLRVTMRKFFDAVEEGNEEVMFELAAKLGREKMQRKDEDDNHGWTALHYAAYKGYTVVITRLINELGFNPSIVDHTNRSALHIAVNHGHQDVARTLIRLGANVEVQDSSGMTPLHLAVFRISPAMVSLLIEEGKADVLARCSVGSVWDLAGVSDDICKILDKAPQENK